LIPVLPLGRISTDRPVQKLFVQGADGIIGCGTILGGLCAERADLRGSAAGGRQPVTVTLFDFISVGKLSIPFAFLVDQLSVLFLLIITGVGFLIHLYSTSYMHEEDGPQFARYFSYLNLFVFSMLLLVLGSNFVILFIGWEGVGLCSYLLIGYWFKNLDFGNAAKKAFIMNRIGDLGFLIAIFLMINKFGRSDFRSLFEGAGNGGLSDGDYDVAVCGRHG
jgi:NADH-quinone oxidoreductase subunit L